MIRLSMGARFNLGAGFAVTMVILLGLFSFYQFQSLNEETQQLLNSDLGMMQFADETSRLVDRFRAQQIQTFMREGAASFTELLDGLTVIRKHVIAGNAASPDMVPNAPAILGLLGDYEKELASFADIPISERLVPFFRITVTHERLLDELSIINHRNQDVLLKHKSSIAEISKSVQIRMAVISTITVLVAFFLSLFFSRQIALPVRRLKVVIDKIREGNYALPRRPDTDDDVGHLFVALTRMTEHIAARDFLKREKILVERARLASLANHLEVPVFVINAENRIAFANNEFLEKFRLVLDDVFEIELDKTPLPPELKSKLASYLAAQTWPVNEPLDIIGDSYAYDLKITLLPVKVERGDVVSVVVLLGRVEAKIGNEGITPPAAK